MIVATRVRCPRCRSCDLSLVEWGECSMAWSVVGGRFDRRLGFFEPGDVLALHAECTRCGHNWRVRKAIQITDVIAQGIEARRAIDSEAGVVEDESPVAESDAPVTSPAKERKG